jgi:hypothetical protein
VNRFFSSLQQHSLFDKWVELLDWLLSDDRFSVDKGWNSAKKGQYTKKASKLDCLKSKNWVCKAGKDIDWTKRHSQNNTPIVQIQKGGSEGEVLITHIRNGIAHGHTAIKKVKSELWIEIKDFGKTGKQTAYLWIPLDYIDQWHKIYFTIEGNIHPDQAKMQLQLKKRNKTVA